MTITLSDTTATTFNQNMDVTLTTAHCHGITSVTMPPQYTAAQFSYKKGDPTKSLDIPPVITVPAGCGNIDTITDFTEFSEILSIANGKLVISDTHTYTDAPTKREKTV